MTYIVTIQDKSMAGEPSIGIAIVDAETDEEARATADSQLDELAKSGRCRCVVAAKPIEQGRFYRPAFLLRGAR